jgi:hypothetical protein
MQQELKLSDDSISTIAKIVQIGILTGTDIVDNLRAIRLISSGEALVPSPEYSKNFDTSIQAMLVEAAKALENA